MHFSLFFFSSEITAPLTSLYENSTTTTTAALPAMKKVEAAPRTSLTQIGSNHEKVNGNANIYSNVNAIQQDNSVKGNDKMII
jgi:hypothetical protein